MTYNPLIHNANNSNYNLPQTNDKPLISIKYFHKTHRGFHECNGLRDQTTNNISKNLFIEIKSKTQCIVNFSIKADGAQPIFKLYNVASKTQLNKETDFIMSDAVVFSEGTAKLFKIGIPRKNRPLSADNSHPLHQFEIFAYKGKMINLFQFAISDYPKQQIGHKPFEDVVNNANRYRPYPVRSEDLSDTDVDAEEELIEREKAVAKYLASLSDMYKAALSSSVTSKNS